jgi:predicted RNase H-like HicB family nuclease
VVEPDEDAWHAWCPALQGYGAATWGKTEAEALRHIQEVVAMIIAELVEDGEALPADETGSAGTLVSVTFLNGKRAITADAALRLAI